MKLNKRALLVEGIILYEIILNYLVFPISIGIDSAPTIIRIIFNTIFFGGLLTSIALVFIVSCFFGIRYLFKWINEEQEEME